MYHLSCRSFRTERVGWLRAAVFQADTENADAQPSFRARALFAHTANDLEYIIRVPAK
jgi:hypothetical protein